MSCSSSLTIAIIAACPFPWPRGTPIRAYRIAETLSQLGHDVHVITYHLGDRFDYPFTVHRIDDIKGYRKTSAGPSIKKMIQLNPALTKLAKVVASGVDFDVVHAIHLEGLLVAKSAMPNLPIVYDAHTSLANELPDYINYLPRRLISIIGAHFDQVIAARADYTIAVSNSLKDRLVEYCGVAETHIEIIPNGVEYDTFQSSTNLRVDTEQLIFTGNDANYQRLDLLLNAFVLLNKIKPQAKLLLVGSANFEKERAFVKDKDLSNFVDIHTTTFTDELKYLAIAAIAISPRTQCDGVPQKILNYMAAGKAIVACEGSAVHIKNGVTGIRVPNNDPQAMALAFSELIDNTQLARSLGEAARREVLAERSWLSVGKKIESAYTKILSS